MLAMIDGFSDNEPAEVETAQPTLEEIQFWYHVPVQQVSTISPVGHLLMPY
jgi:hypothetical protein